MNAKREDEIQALHDICFSKKYSRIDRDTVIRAWEKFSEANDAEWLPLYGSATEIYNHMKPYLPRIHEQDKPYVGGLVFTWLIEVVSFIALAVLAESYQYGGEGIAHTLWFVIGVFASIANIGFAIAANAGD